MKKILYFALFILLLLNLRTEAACPGGTFQHTNGMISNVINSQHPNSFDKYWCLSGGASNNNGTNLSWFQQYQPGIWWINGSWNDVGVNGCCLCSDALSFPSRTMMFKLEQNRNANTALHSGEYTVELCQKSTTNCNLTRAYDRPFAAIPTFHIKSYASTGAGGITTVEIDNWGSVPGPAHYWINRGDGSEGEDLPLYAKCQPDCASSCPEPIVGYRIKAIAAGSPPTDGNSSNWNLTVNNGVITPRIPNFPFTIQIQNPSSCTSSNQFIYIATQLLFDSGFQSNYVSENSAAIDWCTQNPSEAGKEMKCSKGAGDSITCIYTNGGSCTTDNTIYYGPLSSVSSYGYSGAACNLGNSGTATFDPGVGNWFWVIVSNNGSNEGSYGKNSNGQERPEAVGIGSCDYPQNLNNTC